MKLRRFALLVLCASAATTPAFAQANRALTPVAPTELNKFIGKSILGRHRTHLAIVTNVDRDQGTIMVIAQHGEVATIPVSLLGRAGLQLRAPAVGIGDIIRASSGGQSRIPLRGEVTVTEDEASTNSVQ
jgi:hypothetical protein